MKYREIEKAVSQKDITAMQDGDQLLHFLALTGLLKMFSDGITSKEQASDIKRLLREDYESDTQTERISRDELMEVSEIQDKIHHAVMCRGNPWVILIQACRAVSILMRDDGRFWRNVKEDAYLIRGGVLEDAQVYEAERKELLEDIDRLMKAARLDTDVHHKHILSRAVDEHRDRLAYLDQEHGRGEQKSLFGGQTWN